MSVTSISDKNKNLLWAISAGRCQYRGCNKVLYSDILTKKRYNQAYIAHIIADSENGPRGDPLKSQLLKDNIDNLMLLCDNHHRLIDQIEIDKHPVELLKEMKKEHETRIVLSANIGGDKSSHIVIYKANIGKSSPQIDFELAAEYILPNHYPAIESAICLGLDNSPIRDNEAAYWDTEEKTLVSNFNDLLLPKLRKNKIRHISLFAFAPIPLLVKLGALLNEILDVTIHQPTREPKGWNLSDEQIELDYQIHRPQKKAQRIALNLSMSATIEESRIRTVMGEDCDIFNVCLKTPTTDFLKSKIQLAQFRIVMREVLDRISKEYSEAEAINVFPAIPVAMAIEIGRVWMQKSHLPLKIYDQNREKGGFFETITIKNERECGKH